MGIPDEAARAHLLRVITRGMRLDGQLDFDDLARNTPGYVPADMGALAKEAAAVAVSRVFALVAEREEQEQKLPPPPAAPPAAAAAAAPEAGAEASEGAADMDLTGDAAAAPSSSHPFDPKPSASGQLTSDELSDLSINADDFQQALKKVQPSAKREGFATVPNVTWADVGALEDIRRELSLTIVQVRRCLSPLSSVSLCIHSLFALN